MRLETLVTDRKSSFHHCSLHFVFGVLLVVVGDEDRGGMLDPSIAPLLEAADMMRACSYTVGRVDSALTSTGRHCALSFHDGKEQRSIHDFDFRG